MPTSTLTSKGQITLPKEIRDQLHLKTGSKIAFVTDSSGRVVLNLSWVTLSLFAVW